MARSTYISFWIITIFSIISFSSLFFRADRIINILKHKKKEIKKELETLKIEDKKALHEYYKEKKFFPIIAFAVSGIVWVLLSAYIIFMNKYIYNSVVLSKSFVSKNLMDNVYLFVIYITIELLMYFFSRVYRDIKTKSYSKLIFYVINMAIIIYVSVLMSNKINLYTIYFILSVRILRKTFNYTLLR